MNKKASGIKIIAVNRKIRHYMEILETLEAGIALTGPEVKSLRAGKVSFKEGYVEFRRGEAFLVGVHIATYENVGYAAHDPVRPRKLLLHKGEIERLRGKVEQKGLTVVPNKMYFKEGKAKVEIALARGLRLHDRRAALKRKAVERDMAREMAKYK